MECCIRLGGREARLSDDDEAVARWYLEILRNFRRYLRKAGESARYIEEMS